MNLIPKGFYLDDIFNDFAVTKQNGMKCNIYEKENKYYIEMDIPGFDKKDIKIECNNGYVTISAEKVAEENNEDENKKFIRRERTYGKVERSFNFADIDEENIKAEFKDGTLKLCIPKLKIEDTKKSSKENKLTLHKLEYFLYNVIGDFMNLIISHIADIDGITPIILGKIIFKDLEYKLCEASEINDILTELINTNELDKYEKIFITDLSVNLDNAKIIEEKFKDKIKIFDHHLPSLKLNDYSFSYSKVENEFGPACGTSLFLKYLKPLYPELDKKIINDFCELVRISDTWLSDHELFKTARNLEALHSIYGNDKFIEIYTNRLINNEPIFNDQETFLLNVEEESKNNYIKLKEEELIKAELLNYNVGIVFAEKHRSELGNYLAIKYQDTLDFILLIDISRGISYRGIKDINLAEIANIYGGNGHKHASGSPLPENIKETILNYIFKDIVIKK